MCPLFLAFDQLGAHATCLIKSYLMHIPNAELNISQQLFLFYFTGIHLCLQSYAAVDALYSLVYLSVNEASTLTPRLTERALGASSRRIASVPRMQYLAQLCCGGIQLLRNGPMMNES